MSHRSRRHMSNTSVWRDRIWGFENSMSKRVLGVLKTICCRI